MSFPSFVLQTPHRSVSLTCVFGYGMPISPRMTPAERDLARDMHNRGSTPAEVARHLGRHLSSVTRLLARVGADPRRGRPPALTAAGIARAIRVLDNMVVQADGLYEVTVGMVLRRARLKCTERTLRALSMSMLCMYCAWSWLS